MKYIYLFLLVFIANYKTKAQVGIGTNNPEPSAVVEMSATNKGIIIPKIRLTTRLFSGDIGSPVNGITVYNTATSGPVPDNNVTRGYYYWNSLPTVNKWVRLAEYNSGWYLTGNSGTDPSQNFIGNVDNQDVIFKRNNIRAGILSTTNTSFGISSLQNNIQNANSTLGGNHNVAMGFETLYQNRYGSSNIAVGALAFRGNSVSNSTTINFNNIALGYSSLYRHTTQLFNIGIGSSALYNTGVNTSDGHTNTAIGTNSLYANTTGNHNIAIGTEALQNNAGTFNIGLGHLALNKNTGNSNIGIGVQSLFSNISSNENIAIGNSSLYRNTLGRQNSAGGSGALFNNLGSLNSAIGYQSLYNLADINSSNNVAIGYLAGSNLQSGSNNIALGANTNFLNTSASNQLNIANNIIGKINAPVSIGIKSSSLNSTLQVGGSMATNIRNITTNNEEVADNDFTVIVEANNITLPPANIANGRIYSFVKNNNTPHTISGRFRQNGSVTTSYTLDGTNGRKGVVVQGYAATNDWIILSKY